MLIRNIKTGLEQEVSQEQWDAMAINGLQDRFTVKSRSDKPVKAPAQTPAEVINLNGGTKKPKVKPSENPTDKP